jgi:hypothetical protein
MVYTKQDVAVLGAGISAGSDGRRLEASFESLAWIPTGI